MFTNTFNYYCSFCVVFSDIGGAFIMLKITDIEVQEKLSQRGISFKKVTLEAHWQLHKVLFMQKRYRDLSNESRILYAMMLDLYKLSEETTKSQIQQGQNTSFVDDAGYVYCIFSNASIEFMFQVSEKTAINLKKELYKHGLIIEVQQGLRMANRIYVLEPELDDENETWNYHEELKKYEAEKERKAKEKNDKRKKKSGASVDTSLNCKNYSSRTVKTTVLELEKLQSINTDIINTDLNPSVGKLVEDASLVYKNYRQNFKHSTYAKNYISELCEAHTPELVDLAIQRAITGEADKPIAFIKGTLSNWKKASCKTVEDVLKHEEVFKQQKQAEKEKKQQKQNKVSFKGNRTPIRKEIIPDWLEEEKKKEERQRIADALEDGKKPLMSTEELESKKKEIAAMLEQFRTK